jgi:colicin import membrane protein
MQKMQENAVRYDSLELESKSVKNFIEPLHASVITAEELADELQLLAQQELAYEKQYQEHLASLEEAVQQVDKEKKLEQERLLDLKRQTALLAAESSGLALQLAQDKERQQKIEDELFQKKEELRRLDKIQEISQEIFQEKVKTDLGIIHNYRKKIAYHLSSYWKIPYHDQHTQKHCILDVFIIPNGEVVQVTVLEPSGDGVFDQHAINAVYKASPLPCLDELAPKERPRKLTMTFVPESVMAMESFI